MGARGPVRDLPQIVSRTRNPVRKAFHLGASLVGWLAFALGWWRVFLRPLDRWAIPTFELLLLVLLGIVAVNSLWVSYNQGIFRNRPPRTRIRQIDFVGEADRLGRTLVGADWPRLRRGRRISVHLDRAAGTKTYTIEDEGNPGNGP
jgi:hypothetical protein